MKITKWKTDNTHGGVSHTPDYEDPKLHRALRNFIAELGKKYDGDPRISFITAGLLGSWGEWHNYPKSDELWASKETQDIVLNAYESAFSATPILLRYPAKKGHWDQTSNVARPFGYHDDSFAWATLDTGKKKDDWFFIPLLKEAGALEKWKQHPIGGELRPELWQTSFTRKKHKKAQDFFRVRSTDPRHLADGFRAV